MKDELKLQALLDGELPEREAREILALTQRDLDAAKLLNELKQTRQALAKGEAQPALPESREFYWSKIQREIERLDPHPAPSSGFSATLWLRRLFLPLGALAVLTVVATIGFNNFTARQKTVAVTAGMETVLTDEDAFTYQDQQEGTTLVWLSYPASGNPDGKKSTHS